MAQMSLLTCSPSEDEVFTVYGHTAIRVSDPANGIDIVFNYGIFDFSSNNFIYRFAKGKTDYKLSVYYFGGFLAEYRTRGSSVYEQIFNLTSAEKERLWEVLQINVRPENATYRYNFFFDNCATRPIRIIEATVDGKITYRYEPEQKTFRERINYCMRNKPWLVFGCDLALGSPTDRVMTPAETFFLPLLLESALDSATITSPTGEERPLVSTMRSILKEEIRPPERATVFTPLTVSWLLAALLLFITLREWKKKAYYIIVDCLLFTAAGLAGSVLFFLAFASEHPAVWPNWSVIWLHPFHLIGVILFTAKRWRRAAYYYHFINFAALTLMLAGWYFIPQHLNAAFFPLVVCLWTRSGRSVLSSNNKV
jgi:hypothetical protein